MAIFAMNGLDFSNGTATVVAGSLGDVRLGFMENFR
jgi:hypothetical protein